MNDEEAKPGQKLYVYKIIKQKLLEIHNDDGFITDVLVKHLYKKKVNTNRHCGSALAILYWRTLSII